MTKRKITRKRGSSTALWVVLIVAFMAELLLYGWCRVQYVRAGYEISEARQENKRLRVAYNELKIEEARLRSPERVRRIAKARGLVVPATAQVVVIP